MCFGVLRRHGGFLLRVFLVVGVLRRDVRRGTGHTGLRRDLHELREHLRGDLRHFVTLRHALQNRHRAAADQSEQRGRSLHAECLRDLGFAAHVDARELQLAVHAVDRVAEFAGHVEQAIVGRHPHEDDNRVGRRRLRHGLEIVLCHIDHIATRGRCATCLPRLRLDLMLESLEVDGPCQ